MKISRIKAIVKKDIREIFSAKMVLIPLIVVPLVMIVIPIILQIIMYNYGEDIINGVEMIKATLNLYSIPDRFDNLTSQIIYVFLNYTFLPLFLILPLMSSSIISANSIVGEKERGTLETLLYSPITNKELMVAKLLSAEIPAIVITLVGFVFYFTAANIISFIYIKSLIVTSVIWIPVIFLVTPVVSLLGLSVTMIVSIKSKSFMEAQQMSAMVVIPFVIILITQVTGLVTFNVLYSILFSLIIFGISYYIILKIAPRFTREKIICTL